MALTRVKDSISNPRTMHPQEYSSVTSLSLDNGTIFFISTFVSGSWIIDLVDVPTDPANFIIEYTIYWSRTTGGGNPTFRVNGSTVNPQLTAVVSSSSNGAYITKAILMRRDNSWILNYASVLTSTTQASHPAILF